MSFTTTTVDVFATTAYPTDPQVTLTFEPKDLEIVLEHNSAILLVSFDGINDALRINGAYIRGKILEKPIPKSSVKIWYKLSVGVSSPCNAVVTANG